MSGTKRRQLQRKKSVWERDRERAGYVQRIIKNPNKYSTNLIMYFTLLILPMHKSTSKYWKSLYPAQLLNYICSFVSNTISMTWCLCAFYAYIILKALHLLIDYAITNKYYQHRTGSYSLYCLDTVLLNNLQITFPNR